MPSYTPTPRNAYQRSSVLTASQGQLIVMLYDGAHRFLAQAAMAMRDGNVELSHNKLRRAEAIINHLRASLDFEQGGTLSMRLQAIYLFCGRHLNEARVKRDPERVEKVDELLGQLRDAWAQVAGV
jgi:flagellar secretion chaperone FliS